MGPARRRHKSARPVLVLCALAALLAGHGCSDDTSVRPPDPPADSTTGRPVAAQRTLTRLIAALETGDVGAATALAVPAAREQLEALAGNVRTLRLADLSARFVDETALDEDDRKEVGAKAWAGTVELSYRLTGWDQTVTRVETRVVFETGGDVELIAGIGGGTGRTPLWATGPVTALASGRTLVVTTGKDGARYQALARQALVDVGKVLPGWQGRLVVEAPATEQQLDEALAASQEQYANIAAVTTTVDGSLVPGAPVHVFLNPRVFGELGPRGSQVVVSHETTHVATDATFLAMPTWLLEGFADYVALAHSGISVDTAAAQALARIRREGPPDELPSAAELDPTANGLGATYEEAWLAARFIAEQHGEDALVRFYRQVGGGKDVRDVFRTVLGTSQAAFVAQWRDDLRDLAGGVAG